jgi:hypothetical protein
MRTVLAVATALPSRKVGRVEVAGEVTDPPATS